MNIDISTQEKELLLSVLRDRLGTLREQVYHADTGSFRDSLKESKHLLEGLVGKLAPEKTRLMH